MNNIIRVTAGDLWRWGTARRGSTTLLELSAGVLAALRSQYDDDRFPTNSHHILVMDVVGFCHQHVPTLIMMIGYHVWPLGVSCANHPITNSQSLMFIFQFHPCVCLRSNVPTGPITFQWSSGLSKSEISIFWCISMPNKVKLCKNDSTKMIQWKVSKA